MVQGAYTMKKTSLLRVPMREGAKTIASEVATAQGVSLAEFTRRAIVDRVTRYLGIDEIEFERRVSVNPRNRA